MISVIIFVFIFFLFLLLVLEIYFSKTIKRVSAKLEQIEGQVSGYRDFSKYLKHKDRVELSENISFVLVTLQHIFVWRILLTQHQRTLVEEYDKRGKEFEAFLRAFIPEYTQKEVERYKEFFSVRQFDHEQLEAIVKQDTHHLVIAAAGSGKTRTLVARIAFIIHCGVRPEDILALAYTNPAEDEMRRRLKNEYGIQKANVKTFHSLGREFARLSPKYRADVADAMDTQKFIREGVKTLCNEREFAGMYLRFAIEFRTEEKEQNNIGQTKKLYSYLQNQRYVVLNGQRVKSIAERDIANCLFLNKVKFEYETPVKWADKTEEYRQYEPDFYLPDYGIWIEHWAINRQGQVPEWFSSDMSRTASQKYKEAMEWKREQFKKHHHKLIETYNYQSSEHTLVPTLKRQLLRNHVDLKVMTVPEIMETVKSLIPNPFTVYELMFSFISKAKTNGLKIDDIHSRLSNGTWSREQEAFASMMIRIWQEYESMLKQNKMIDFNDMINLALEVVQKQNGQQRSFTHVLVDEFQDITDPQLEILKCLLHNKENSMLFCVGDNRQNIFSFAGSNIYNILQFNKIFPYAEETNLSTNYRCPKNVVAASNHIDKLNKVRVDAMAVSASQLQNPIRLIEMPDDIRQDYEEWEFQKALELVRQLDIARGKSEQILVLSRNNFRTDRLMMEFPRHESEGIEFSSIHRAKGTEAEYVLLLGCIKGRNGFPSEIEDQDVLDIVQKSHDENAKLEEERRLFYVAITRCKKEIFLFTSRKAKSQFISEIEPYISAYEVPLNKS